MRLYWQDEAIAIEVIPEPEHLEEATMGPDVPVIYVSEEQVGNPALVEALAQLVLGRGDKETRRAHGPEGTEKAARAGDAEDAETRQTGGKLSEEDVLRIEDLMDAQEELLESLLGAKVPEPQVFTPLDDELDMLEAYERAYRQLGACFPCHEAGCLLAGGYGMGHQARPTLVSIGNVGSLNLTTM